MGPANEARSEKLPLFSRIFYSHFQRGLWCCRMMDWNWWRPLCGMKWLETLQGGCPLTHKWSCPYYRCSDGWIPAQQDKEKQQGKELPSAGLPGLPLGCNLRAPLTSACLPPPSPAAICIWKGRCEMVGRIIRGSCL